MREILFRGKREVDGEWIYGYYADEKAHETDFPCIVPLKNTENDHNWSVIPETVGQYTGRIGEDKKKIFEGDMCILTTFDHNGHDTQHEVSVEYSSGSFYFVNEEKEFYMCISDVEDAESDVIILGSIHDTPELLEGAAE